MRLIDADNLNARLSRNGTPYYTVPDIENAPTVDAVPVVRGRWEQDADGDWYCTNCDEAVAICDSGKNRTYHKPYCPNCGAKMDGGAGHEDD